MSSLFIRLSIQSIKSEMYYKKLGKVFHFPDFASIIIIIKSKNKCLGNIIVQRCSLSKNHITGTFIGMPCIHTVQNQIHGCHNNEEALQVVWPCHFLSPARKSPLSRLTFNGHRWWRRICGRWERYRAAFQSWRRIGSSGGGSHHCPTHFWV